MGISIKDEATSRAARQLAAIKGKTVPEVVRDALQNELMKETARAPLAERLRRLSERYRAHQETGLEADKAFFDKLSDPS